ncbi:RNA-binding protein 18 [Marchantia polymorpha subsp. ruderalis]|uniref:Probable RNA-binding protein 18 n=2 Tax=Marchantia polymorpha TaxID=3197 RepID=A0A176VG38_MARPO|nr:hypothetical protein AXG93_960s1120 [Marchantia polymorpha subsp. ruderalis]PTQ28775.1 hypothetical protein MARPO_0154s0007 [Marchantia polymorpha]BBN20117.1 hypothetical protein Mp_8g16570 [Marchantia polymorpha subsp. ruderalis]|eukprot:PTQ28775.1 hypothetical protein MARPO_0154s0007 [Marchantia polymorpha]
MLKRCLEVDKEGLGGEKREHKLYIGNLDHRVTEYHVIKLFSPFGKIRCEEYMWHTHGPKRGEPRGFAFVEYSKREDAERAKASMNGRLAFGRPLVVRFVDEKVVTHNNDVPSRSSDGWSSGTNKSSNSSAPSALSSSKSAKIAAIQNKLKLMEKEEFQDNESGPRKIAKTSATSRLHSSRSV